MFLFILQPDEPTFSPLTWYLFLGLIILWFIFTKFKSRFSKKICWILGSIIIAVGIFFSIYRIEDVSILFGVLVIFFGITIMPMRHVLVKFKNKIIKPNPKPSKDDHNKSDSNYTQVKSEEYILKGKEYKNKQKYQKAIDSFVRALKVNPNSAESWYELGLINFVRNRIPESLICYERAIDIKPAYTEAIEKYKEAEQILKDSGKEQEQK